MLDEKIKPLEPFDAVEIDVIANTDGVDLDTLSGAHANDINSGWNDAGDFVVKEGVYRNSGVLQPLVPGTNRYIYGLGHGTMLLNIDGVLHVSHSTLLTAYHPSCVPLGTSSLLPPPFGAEHGVKSVHCPSSAPLVEVKCGTTSCSAIYGDGSMYWWGMDVTHPGYIIPDDRMLRLLSSSSGKVFHSSNGYSLIYFNTNTNQLEVYTIAEAGYMGIGTTTNSPGTSMPVMGVGTGESLVSFNLSDGALNSALVTNGPGGYKLYVTGSEDVYGITAPSNKLIYTDVTSAWVDPSLTCTGIVPVIVKYAMWVLISYSNDTTVFRYVGSPSGTSGLSNTNWMQYTETPVTITSWTDIVDFDLGVDGSNKLLVRFLRSNGDLYQYGQSDVGVDTITPRTDATTHHLCDTNVTAIYNSMHILSEGATTSYHVRNHNDVRIATSGSSIATGPVIHGDRSITPDKTIYKSVVRNNTDDILELGKFQTSLAMYLVTVHKEIYVWGNNGSSRLTTMNTGFAYNHVDKPLKVNY